MIRESCRVSHRVSSCLVSLPSHSLVPCRFYRCLRTQSFSTTIEQPKEQQQTSATTKPQRIPIQVPPPTWSIASLELHKQHPPISSSELDVLAKRAVILIDPGPLREQLCQDLGNMMHMINKVQDFVHVDDQNSNSSGNQSTANHCSDQEATWLYDVPRGVTVAPFRYERQKKSHSNDHVANTVDPKLEKENSVSKSSSNTTTESATATTVHAENDTNFDYDDNGMNPAIRQSLLEPKMTRVGSHCYFEIVTARNS